MGLRSVLIAFVAIIVLSTFVDADVYMHSFRGSNNRLNEANRDRNNGNRLFDSQNNNRGGANAGTFGREYFYHGSIQRIEWTNQHSCANPNANCDIILQYYCDKSNANTTRDGVTTNRIPDVTTQLTDCRVNNCDYDTKYGRHESFEEYQSCKYRSRNKGLYTSTQDMNGRHGAIFTRQNNNGDRHGYECPEERDYYPYWHPTKWVDIAIITNDTARCPAWQAESQNVKGRFHCEVSAAYIDSKVGTDPANRNQRFGFIPITEADCIDSAVGGKWVPTPAHGVAAPQCVQAQWTRDNHLGNTYGGETPHFDWTIPSDFTGMACVFRLRYNISTSETRNGGEWASDTSVQAGWLNSTMNYIYKAPPAGINIDQNNDDVTTQNPRFFKWADQLDVWTRYGLSKGDSIASFIPVSFYSDEFMTSFPSRGYVFRNDPVVDIFGSLIPRSTLPQTNQALPTVVVALRLALDTSQYSRTFQDRSHTFSIRSRAGNQALTRSTGKLYNLGVRGKRGNIVQTYPGTEYDFVPNQLTLNQGDWIHFQWTGSNTNPGNNAGQGTAGTDRSNIVVLEDYSNPWAPVNTNTPHGPFSGTDGTTHVSNWKLSYPSRIDSGLDFMGLNTNNKRQLARNGIYSPYFDLAPVQMRNAGIFNYLCTRNNAFTNRGQKAQITVKSVPNAEALMVTVSSSSAQFVSVSGGSWIRFAPDPLGQTTNSQINIQELEDGRLLITPPLFDVVPGQAVMLDITYTERPLTDVYVYQSDFENYNGDEITTKAVNGVASTKIVKGGYYHVEQTAAGSAVAGLVVGVLAAFGLAGFGYYKLKQKFHIRDKKYIEAAQSASPVSV